MPRQWVGATPTRYIWLPPFPLQDLAKPLTTYLHHYGLTERAPEAIVGAAAMVRPVHYAWLRRLRPPPPCGVDLVLQPEWHRCGSDIDAATQGYPAETEERMLMRAIFKEAADEAQSASRQLQTAMATDSEGAGVAAPANEDGGGSGAAAAGRPCTASSDAAHTDTSVEASVPAGAASLSAPERSTGQARRCSEDHDSADRAELLARRRLLGSAQPRKRCRSATLLRATAPSRPATLPRQLFAIPWREDLAASRALLVDASALLQYYYEVLDTLPATTSPAGPSSPFSAPSAFLCGLPGLRMRATILPALRCGAPFEVRGQPSCQRRPVPRRWRPAAPCRGVHTWAAQPQSIHRRRHLLCLR